MRNLFIAILLISSTWCFAEKATYKTAPVPRIYSTGLLKHKKMEAELLEFKFEKATGDLPKAFHLKSLVELAPIKDQKSCGSCVYNAVAGALEDIHRIRGVILPTLSRQFLMDCAAEWSCNGSFFDKVAGGLLAQGGTPTEAMYPYKAYDQQCQGRSTELLGKIASYKLISNSAKSIMAAVYAGYPVPVTVGADNRFMSYSSGVYNGCTNQATNHQVVVEGFDCETSVDATGKCVFDSNGKLPPGVGVYHVRNSWGSGWGDQGWISTKVTSQSGMLCNNIAEEAGILEPMVQPKPPEPPAPPVPPAPAPSNLPQWVLVALGALVTLVIGLGYLLIKKKD